MVTLMFSGYAVGGMLAALLGKGLIETYGWHRCSSPPALPVLLIPLILKSMPESMPFLIKANRLDELKNIAVAHRTELPAAARATASRCRAKTRPTARRSGTCSTTAAASAR